MDTPNSSSYAKTVGAVMTPLRWAKWLVRESGFVSKWMQGATVCDPTAGRGVFLSALIDVAREDGMDVDDKMLSRLFLIEREPEFLQEFHESFQFKYKRAFPKQNTICADIVLENPGRKFDLLVGNPPWVNFNDLPQAYKEQLKGVFIANGLVDDNQLLLLGCARVDFSALVLAVAMKNNVEAHGEGIFFLPLSLFQNDGAHSGFRRYSIGDTVFRPVEIWAFTETKVFPEVATRFGAVRFERDAVVSYPIPYRIESGGEWIKRFAAPVGDPNAPLAVLDSALEFEQMPVPVLIDVREGQKPRQGVNTCGANSVFIFDHAPKAVPQKFVFPLITKECFDESRPTPRKHILLPYDKGTGRPLDETALKSHPSLAAYFFSQKSQLLARKGTLLNTWIKRGMWWACLGVGEYCFAPFKIVWEAYGKSNFRPQIFGCADGQPWQANQAMQAFIPCSTLAEAEDLLDRLENSNIESYLKSLSVEGTCNWAQPGRIKRFLQFIPETKQAALELQL
jgi:hypothetical protein